MRGESAQIERVSETGTIRRVGDKDFVLVAIGLDFGDSAGKIPDWSAGSPLAPTARAMV
jgi:hypothetical protein